MKRATRPALMAWLFLLLIIPALGESGRSLYKKGRIAEARQNYEQAYDLYKQAYEQNPQDLSYRSAYERLRFLAGASHVHRGQLLREAGRLEEALAEFRKAAEIDPSSAIAKQEIQIVNQMIQAAKKTPAPETTTHEPSVLEKRLEQAGGPVELGAIPNVPINLKITEDSRVIYETIGKLAGINVLFDPDYTSRRIKVELNSVSLEEALEIVALESRTFWRPVTANTIFVAADNPAKRKDLEQSVIKTFYLSNLSQPTELQDVVNALRQILEIARIQPLPSEGAIVVRGSPDQVALAQKLVSDLDKSKPEVIVDVAVLQISKDKKRTLGINPPTSMTVQLQPNVTTTTPTTTTTGTNTTTGTTTTTPTSTTASSGSINLNSLANLNATDFQVTVAPATISALLSDSNTKLIQNPQIRSLDGQKASLKIGDRIPVATGSFQPGIGGVGINPLVNTQFQYLDVGVNIDITPRIHSTGEVTLKISMDISSETGTTNIGGIEQPIIGRKLIEHEVRLREGEANLMGGMLEDLQSKNLSGIPGLAQIPLLKYLFGQTATEHSQTETVFVMIPHIVRRQVLSALNEEAVDVGTASAIGLRRVGHSVSAAPAQSAGPSAGAGAVAVPQPPTPSQQPEPELVQRGASGGASFAFDPPTSTQRVGSTFTVNVLLNGAQNVYSVPLQLSYDPKLLQVVNVSNGSLLSQDGQIVTVTHREDDSTGTMQVTATRPPGAPGISGQGAVVTLTLLAKSPGQASLTIARGGARDPAMQALAVSGASATVTIQ
ncbi:MAG: tetratricopeptide repeat protein [Acidobacteria bacterium]|nr:tetratricopeptide repeat protein [Acidobacteriota bacterium]MBV9626019.1 tetratricopeptide repeat protein [Acidobacteriota bacterium]